MYQCGLAIKFARRQKGESILKKVEYNMDVVTITKFPEIVTLQTFDCSLLIRPVTLFFSVLISALD